MSDPNYPHQGYGQTADGSPGQGYGQVPADPSAGYQQPPSYGQPGYQEPAETPTDPALYENASWQDAKDIKAADQDAGYYPDEAPAVEYDQHDGPQVIQTDAGASDGLTKCVKCGATDISLNVATGQLRCNFCRHQWSTENAGESFNLETPIGDLQGITIGSGATAIVPDVSEVVSFKCSACGAEVVVDTAHSNQSRCHWCRNTLSMNQQIPNGAVPDVILPFSVPKEQAVANIEKFVKKRKFFAHKKFKAEFEPNNVVGVYLPYMIVDVNASLYMAGSGEHETRRYRVKTGENSSETRYDADVYQVVRQFDLHVDDLTVESSKDKLNQNSGRNTNNIINTIMPFDTKNAVRYDSNYLSGFSSEKRDTDLEDLTGLVQLQAQDIGRHRSLETIKFYDRGVRWEQEHIDVKGQRWISAYLPVWLYSYYERKSNGKELLHYVAVNGRTGETMGSIPIAYGKLWIASGIVEVFGGLIFAAIALF